MHPAARQYSGAAVRWYGGTGYGGTAAPTWKAPQVGGKGEFACLSSTGPCHRAWCSGRLSTPHLAPLSPPFHNLARPSFIVSIDHLNLNRQASHASTAAHPIEAITRPASLRSDVLTAGFEASGPQTQNLVARARRHRFFESHPPPPNHAFVTKRPALHLHPIIRGFPRSLLRNSAIAASLPRRFNEEQERGRRRREKKNKIVHGRNSAEASQTCPCTLIASELLQQSPALRA